MHFNLANSIAILERTPSVLTTLLHGLEHEWTHADEGPETWSPFNVVGHLIDGEETDWLVRVRIIMEGGAERRFKPVDRFRHLEANKGRTLAEALDLFADLRAQNLVEMKSMNLTPADLQRTGEHPAFGEVTLEQLLATWTVHDLGHIAQISRVMAKQYKAAVGPWEAYLTILHR